MDRDAPLMLGLAGWRLGMSVRVSKEAAAAGRP